MLSLGISAWHDEPLRYRGDVPPSGIRFTRLGSFSCNVLEISGASWDPDTHVWWSDPARAAALKETTKNPLDPWTAMSRLMDFIGILPGVPHVWAAYPATFDMPFVRYYAQRFARERWTTFYQKNPMERIAAFDMGSYAMRILGCGFHEVSKELMPPSWTAFHNPLPHVALNDAEEQAHLLMAMLSA
jgi:hypothetical protein